jgi:hypothetical protein
MRIKLKRTASRCIKSLGRFEPTIFCSDAADDDHYTTPPGQTYIVVIVNSWLWKVLLQLRYIQLIGKHNSQKWTFCTYMYVCMYVWRRRRAIFFSLITFSRNRRFVRPSVENLKLVEVFMNGLWWSCLECTFNHKNQNQTVFAVESIRIIIGIIASNPLPRLGGNWSYCRYPNNSFHQLNNLET